MAFRRGSVSPHSGGTVPDSHRVPLPLAYRARAYHGPAMALPRRFSVWAPVVLWAAVIFALSSIPSLNSGLGGWDYVLRKAAHMTEYAILFVLLWRALGSERPALALAFAYLTEYAILGALLLRALGRVAPAFLLGVAYAVTDEIHQHFVRGRHASPFDVAFDAAGVALGLLVALSVQSNRARTKELRRPAAGRDPGAPRRAPGRAADAEPPA